MDLAIMGIALMPLVLGLVEFLKKLGLAGNWCIVVAVVLGSAFGGLGYAIGLDLIPSAWLPWIGVGIGGLAFGLGTAGLYDFSKRFQQ